MNWPDDYINKVICGDSREIMKGIPDGAVGLVVTDPPYGVGLGTTINGKAKDKGQMKYEDFDDTPEYVRTVCVPIINLCIQKSDRVILTPGNRNVWLYPPPDDSGVWFNPAGTSHGRWGYQLAQPILYYGKDPRAGLGSTASSCWGKNSSVANIKNTLHPCPKPLDFVKWLVHKGSIDVNDIILDPLAGSGTTLVAAKQLGRKYIGIDLSAKYCKIAEDRLRQEELF